MATHARKPAPKRPPDRAIQKDGLFTGTLQGGPARSQRAHALAEELLARGNLFVQKHVWEEAANEYRKAIQMEPGYAEASNNLGLSLYYMKKYKEAVENLQAALHSFPGWYIAEANLGMTLAKLNRNEEAAQHYERSLTVKEQPAVWLSLGDIYAVLGKLEKSLEAYEKAIAGNPRYGMAYHRVGMLQARRNKVDDAETALNKAVEIDPANTEAWGVLGAIAARKGNLTKARNLFAKVEKVEKVPAPAQRGLRRLEVARQGLDKAFAEWQASMPEPAKLALCYYNLGLAQIKAGDQAAAKRSFQQAAEADTLWVEPLAWFGFFSALDGDAAGARKQWESALKLNQEHGLLWEQLGYLAVAMGLQKDGETHFAEAIKLGRRVPNEHIYPDQSARPPAISAQTTTIVTTPEEEGAPAASGGEEEVEDELEEVPDEEAASQKDQKSEE